MTVYVDNALIPYRGMKMSHMIADTLDELHAMADQLGLRRAWFQPKSFPHYDICKAKREEAIGFGVKPVGRHELVKVMREFRVNND